MNPFVGSAHAAEGSGLPQLDVGTYPSQLFWLLLSVLVLYFLLSRLVLPRISEILKTREQTIAGDLDRAQAFHDRAQNLREEIERQRAETRAEAQKIAAESREATMQEIAAEQEAAEKRLDEAATRGEERIRAIRDAAVEDVGAVARDVAGALVVEILKRPADGARVQSAVQARLG